MTNIIFINENVTSKSKPLKKILWQTYMTFSPSHRIGQTEGQCFGFTVKGWDVCSDRCGILRGGSWKHCACHSLCWHDIVSVLVHDCRSGLATLKHRAWCSAVVAETQCCCLGLSVLSAAPASLQQQSPSSQTGYSVASHPSICLYSLLFLLMSQNHKITLRASVSN